MARFIDLFAGMGGIRIGFESAFNNAGIQTDCVLTSEIKPHAIKALAQNFPDENIFGDICKVRSEEIPDFDFLLAGFPCQPFSAAGNRQGFADTRGTLFFEIERILKDKRPFGFLLENVEGLVKHDLRNKKDELGHTLSTILNKLRGLGYDVTWKVLNSADFDTPQDRKRVYIVGTLNGKVDLKGFESRRRTLNEVMENGLPTLSSKFTKLLLKHFNVEDLYGKSIKDKRGGVNNIHSWDIGLKGEVTNEQIQLLDKLFKERRRKKWAEEIGIDWMDGMPLTQNQINSFFPSKKLKSMLQDLVKKGYLVYEHPKKKVVEFSNAGKKEYRVYDTSLQKGYNIVSGKLSFEINKVLNPRGIAPTLVATDMEKLALPDGNGLRRISIREGLRMFGYPENYRLELDIREAYDLLGNTVSVKVIESIAERLVEVYENVVV
jgi:DNA (cytosine-5)-methyltransferase 1